MKSDRKAALGKSLLSCCIAGLLATVQLGAAPQGPAYWEIPDEAGDYAGERKALDGKVEPIVAQVIPDADGAFRVRLARELDRRVDALIYLDGTTLYGDIVFEPGVQFLSDAPLLASDQGLLFRANQWSMGIGDGVMTGSIQGSQSGSLVLKPQGHGRYKSDTLWAKPPKGATVLFAGKSLRHFKDSDGSKARWKVVDGKAFETVEDAGGVVSEATFGDHHLHIEFRSSWMPEARGQRRGNSGVYLQGRYEVQVLDSYGLTGEWNECGGIYKVAKPIVNMCAPPTLWQTYDIDFTAPRFNAGGEKVANARITVLHNGVLIHDDVELPEQTGGALGEEVEAGPLMLQNHGGDPVQYRNIWVVEKEG